MPHNPTHTLTDALTLYGTPVQTVNSLAREITDFRFQNIFITGKSIAIENEMRYLHGDLLIDNPALRLGIVSLRLMTSQLKIIVNYIQR